MNFNRSQWIVKIRWHSSIFIHMNSFTQCGYRFLYQSVIFDVTRCDIRLKERTTTRQDTYFGCLFSDFIEVWGYWIWWFPSFFSIFEKSIDFVFPLCGSQRSCVLNIIFCKFSCESRKIGGYKPFWQTKIKILWWENHLKMFWKMINEIIIWKNTDIISRVITELLSLYVSCLYIETWQPQQFLILYGFNHNKTMT